MCPDITCTNLHVTEISLLEKFSLLYAFSAVYSITLKLETHVTIFMYEAKTNKQTKKKKKKKKKKKHGTSSMGMTFQS